MRRKTDARRSPSGRKPVDFFFLVVVITLLAIGLIMVFSASSEASRFRFNGDSYHFIRRQVLWAAISLGVMFVISNINYKLWRNFSKPILWFALISLLLVLILGSKVNGATRWIDLKVAQFQPTEVAKIAIILYFASAIASNGGRKLAQFKGLLPYLGLLLVCAALIMLEPHFSATVVILFVGVVMLIIGGANIWHFAIMMLPAIPVAAFMIIKEPYRMQRITAFIDPFKDKLGDGWQTIQSLYAIGSGGIFGMGLGKSRQKFLYIPEPHNDFIFSILCEELGLLGALVTIALFALLIWRGIKIAMNAPDMFSSLVAFGITAMLAIEIIVNIAVVTSTMPVTGMPLPFFSYGGTALLTNLVMMGIMLNISRYSKTNSNN